MQLPLRMNLTAFSPPIFMHFRDKKNHSDACSRRILFSVAKQNYGYFNRESKMLGAV